MKFRWMSFGTCIMLGTLTMVAGCSSMGNMFSKKLSATAVLAPTKGNSVSGTVNFVQKGEVVMIEAKINGLGANGVHAIHIHEKGNCTGDGSSAGAHFNPDSSRHGGPTSTQRHAGDLGNLTADANGFAQFSLSVGGITLGTGDKSIIGRAVIIHAGTDDFKTQPSGNAGARVACGLVSKNPDRVF